VQHRDYALRQHRYVIFFDRLSICRRLVRLEGKEATPMQYVLLIYDEEKKMAKMTESDRGQMFAEYGAITADMKAKKQWVDGAPLQPVSSATSVRVRDGKRLVTDGPFAETKEQLGGFYLVEAKDLDEALGIAARIPAARGGTIEVRPVMKM
jgi:hypothetical protein